jgi:hypothetical protein
MADSIHNSPLWEGGAKRKWRYFMIKTVTDTRVQNGCLKIKIEFDDGLKIKAHISDLACAYRRDGTQYSFRGRDMVNKIVGMEFNVKIVDGLAILSNEYCKLVFAGKVVS